MRTASITPREREGEERQKGGRSHVAAQGVATKTSGLAGGRRFCANSRLQSAVWSAEIEAVERRRYPRVHTRGPIEARNFLSPARIARRLSAGSHPRPH